MSTPAPRSPRVSFALNDEHRDILKRLEKELDLTPSEVVQAALRLLWAETAK